MSEELTAWFPPEIRPVRKGVYQTRLECDDGEVVTFERWSYWNGRQWCDSAPSKLAAFQSRGKPVRFRKMWRGLTKRARATGKGE